MSSGRQKKSLRMKIPLDLSRHCVRTEILRHYHRRVSLFLRGQCKDLQNEGFVLEVLKWCLEEVDLVGLRSSFPELAGGAEHLFFLEADVHEVRLLDKNRIFFQHPLPELPLVCDI